MIKEENAYLLNSSTFFVADMVIPFGGYGHFVWPMWSWPIWFVADMVCGRYGTDPLKSVLLWLLLHEMKR